MDPQPPPISLPLWAERSVPWGTVFPATFLCALVLLGSGPTSAFGYGSGPGVAPALPFPGEKGMPSFAAISPLSGSPHPREYSLTFKEVGLTHSSRWSVSVAGASLSTTASSLTFNVTNGTYAYAVGTPDGYATSERTGTVQIQGASQTIPLTFTPQGRAPSSPASPGGIPPLFYLLGGAAVAAVLLGLLLARRRSGRQNAGGGHEGLPPGSLSPSALPPSALRAEWDESDPPENPSSPEEVIPATGS